MEANVTDEQIHQIPWLLTRFVEQIPGLTAVVCFDEDGLLGAMSDGVSRGHAEELVAIASGLSSLAAGAARHLDRGQVKQVGIEMASGYLFVVAVSGGSYLCVVTDDQAELSTVNYEMMVLADRFSSVLSPDVHRELRGLLPVR